MKKSSGIVVIVYAILVLIGGIIGFIKANSVSSLVMGTGFAIALLLSGYGLLKRSLAGLYASSALTVVLTLFFAFRFYKTHVFMPAGLMFILGIAVIATLFYNRRNIS